MTQARHALLGACLALPIAAYAGHAMAQQAPGGRTVYVPPGAVVLIVPGPGPIAAAGTTTVTPADFPVARMVVQQMAAMQDMMANMNSLMLQSFPDPQRMIQSVMDGAGAPGGGSGIATCSETITYGAPDANGRPQVKVTRSGNACGALTSSGPLGVSDQPAPAVVPQPVPAPHQPRLWTIGDPPQPVSRATPPRT